MHLQSLAPTPSPLTHWVNAKALTDPLIAPCPLRAKLDGPYDSRGLPILLSTLMVLSMSIVFGGAFLRISETAAPPP